MQSALALSSLLTVSLASPVSADSLENLSRAPHHGVVIVVQPQNPLERLPGQSGTITGTIQVVGLKLEHDERGDDDEDRDPKRNLDLLKLLEKHGYRIVATFPTAATPVTSDLKFWTVGSTIHFSYTYKNIDPTLPGAFDIQVNKSTEKIREIEASKARMDVRIQALNALIQKLEAKNGKPEAIQEFKRKRAGLQAVSARVAQWLSLRPEIIAESRSSLQIGNATAADSLTSTVMDHYRLGITYSPGSAIQGMSALITGQVTHLRPIDWGDFFSPGSGDHDRDDRSDREGDGKLLARFFWQNAQVKDLGPTAIEEGQSLSFSMTTDRLQPTDPNVFGMSLYRWKQENGGTLGRKLASLTFTEPVDWDRVPPTWLAGSTPDAQHVYVQTPQPIFAQLADSYGRVDGQSIKALLTGGRTDGTAVNQDLTSQLAISTSDGGISYTISGTLGSLADGYYNLALFGSDLARNTSVPSPHSALFRVDTVSPGVTLSQSGNVCTSQASATVSATITDWSPVTLNVTNNGAPALQKTISPADITSPLNQTVSLTVPLQDGQTNTLVFNAVDAAGNALTQPPQVQIYRDSTSPIVTLGKKDNIYTNKQAFNLPVGIQDDSATQAVVLQNGQQILATTEKSFTVAATLVLGVNTFEVDVTDCGGNVTSAKLLSITYDPVPPIITMVSPSFANPGSIYLNQRSPTVFGYSNKPLSLARIDGQLMQLSPDLKSFSYTFAGVPDGPLPLHAEFADLATNAVVVETLVWVDTTAPVISVQAPSSLLTNQSQLVLPVSVADMSPTSVTVILNGQTAMTSTAASFAANLQLAPGPNTIEIDAVDAAGNAATPVFIRNLVLDQIPPVLSQLSPSGTVPTLSVNPSGTSSKVLKSASVNGTTLQLSSGGLSFSGSLAFSAPGTYPLHWVATDLAGNTAAQDTTVTIDLPPSIALAVQDHVRTNQNQFLIAVSIFTMSGKATTTILQNGTQVYQTTAGSIQFMATLVNGTNTFEIDSVSATGQRATPARLTDIVLDTSPAMLTGLSPGVNVAATSLTFPVSGQASKSVKSVFVNGQRLALSGDGLSFTGSYTVQSDASFGLNWVVTDQAGNITRVSYPIQIDLNQPQPTTNTTPPGLYVGAHGDFITSDPNFQLPISVLSASTTTTMVKQNGNVIYQGSDTGFFVPVTLAQGANTFTISSVDAQANVSTTVQLNNIVYDPAPPALSQLTPGNGASVPGSLINLSGKSDKKLNSIKVNGNALTLGSDLQSFSGQYLAPQSQGNGNLLWEAQSQAGVVTRVNTVVVIAPTGGGSGPPPLVQPPQLAVNFSDDIWTTSPAVDVPFTVSSAAQTSSAVFVNGKPATTTSQTQFTATLNLLPSDTQPAVACTTLPSSAQIPYGQLFAVGSTTSSSGSGGSTSGGTAPGCTLSAGCILPPGCSVMSGCTLSPGCLLPVGCTLTGGAPSAGGTVASGTCGLAAGCTLPPGCSFNPDCTLPTFCVLPPGCLTPSGAPTVSSGSPSTTTPSTTTTSSTTDPYAGLCIAPNVIQIQSSDVFGNVSQKVTRYVFYKSKAPTLFDLVPQDQMVLASNQFNVSGQSLNPVKSAFLNGFPLTVSQSGLTFGGTYVQTMGTGIVNLNWAAQDQFGLIATAEVPVIINSPPTPGSPILTTPPTITLGLKPMPNPEPGAASDGFYYTSQTSVNLPFTVADTLQTLTKVSLNNAATLYEGTDSSIQVTVPLAQDGLSVVTITAIDGQGNRSSTSVNFYRRAHPPVLSVTTPAPYQTLTSRSIAISGSSSAKLASIQVNHQALSIASSLTSFSGTYSASSDGAQNLVVQATDYFGNVGALTLPVIVNTAIPASGIRPAILIGTRSSVGGSATNYIVPVTISDPVPTVTQVYKNGALYETTLDPNFSIPVSYSSTSGTPDTYVVTSTDTSGNSNSQQFQFSVNINSPHLTLTSPQSGPPMTGTFTVSGTSDRALASAFANAQPLQVSSNGLSFSGSYSVTTNGFYTLDVKGVTADGVASDSTMIVLVQDSSLNGPINTTVPPSLTLGSKDNILTGSAQFQLPITIASLSATTIQVYLNGSLASTLYSNPGIYQLQASLNLREGVNAILVQATDSFGNPAIPASLSNIELVTQAPTLAVNFSDNLSTMNPFQQVPVNVTSPISTSTVVILNGQRVYQTTAANFVVPIQLTAGRNTLAIQSTDVLGHPSQAVTFNNLTLSLPGPVLSNLSPSKDSTVNGLQFTLSGQSDKQLRQVLADGVPLQIDFSARLFFGTYSVSAPGPRTITLSATATDGTTTQVQLPFNIAASPVISNLSVHPNDVIRSLSFPISGFISFPVSSVTVSNSAMNNTQSMVLAPDGLSFNGLYTAQTEGALNLHLVASDKYGNSAVQDIPVTILLSLLKPALVSVQPSADGTKLAIVGAPGAAKAGETVTASVNFFNTKSGTVAADGSFVLLMLPFQQATVTVSDAMTGISESATVTFGLGTSPVLSGKVLDIDNRPILHAKVTLSGTFDVAYTDATGAYQFNNPPTGDQKITADGSTAQPGNDGITRNYSKDTFAITIGMSASNVVKPIFLGYVRTDGTQTQIVAGSPATVTDPNAPGFMLQIPAGAATFPNGSQSGAISVTKIPISVSTLPPLKAAMPDAVYSLQPSGVQLSQRAPIAVPNVNSLPPGTDMVIFSQDSQKGIWTIDGTATVSASGTSVISKPNSGISHFSAIYMAPLSPLVHKIGAQDRPGADTFNGAVSSTITLPSYKVLGQSVAPTLIYKSPWAKPSVIVTNLFDIPRQEVDEDFDAELNSTDKTYRKFNRKYCVPNASCFDGPDEYLAKTQQFEYHVHTKSWFQPKQISSRFAYVDSYTAPLYFNGDPVHGLDSKSVVSYGIDFSDDLQSGVYPFIAHYEITLDHITIGTRSFSIYERIFSQASGGTLVEANDTKYQLPATQEQTVFTESVPFTQQSYSDTQTINGLTTPDLTGQVFVQNKIHSPAGRGWMIGGPQSIQNVQNDLVFLEESDGKVSTYAANNLISTVVSESDLSPQVTSKEGLGVSTYEITPNHILYGHNAPQTGQGLADSLYGEIADFGRQSVTPSWQGAYQVPFLEGSISHRVQATFPTLNGQSTETRYSCHTHRYAVSRTWTDLLSAPDGKIFGLTAQGALFSFRSGIYAAPPSLPYTALAGGDVRPPKIQDVIPGTSSFFDFFPYPLSYDPLGQVTTGGELAVREGGVTYTSCRNLLGIPVPTAQDVQTSLVVCQGGGSVDSAYAPHPDLSALDPVSQYSIQATYNAFPDTSPCDIQPGGVGGISPNATPQQIAVINALEPPQGTYPNTGFSDGYGSAARMNNPMAMTLAPSIYGAGSYDVIIADYGNHRVRRYNLQTGIMITIAGDGRAFDLLTDGEGALQASLFHPRGVAADQAGNIYVSTEGGFIRRIDPKGAIWSLAGGILGMGGLVADSAPAKQMVLDHPSGMAIDNDRGFLYVADTGSNRVVRIDLQTLQANTAAGNHDPTFNGDNIPAISASLSAPNKLWVDSSGNLSIADAGHGRIRYVNFQAGSGSGTGQLFIATNRDQSTLQRFPNGTWRRTYRNGSTADFDGYGHQITLVDRMGRTTRYGYDSSTGFLTTMTDPVGKVTRYDYAQGHLSTITDPVGRQTQFGFNIDGTLTSVIYPDGTSRHFTYMQGGLLQTDTDQRSKTTQYIYNGLHRLNQIVRPDLSVQVVSDSASQSAVNNSTNAGAPAVVHAYGDNPSDAHETVTDANGNSSMMLKDFRGYVAQGTDAVGRTLKVVRDDNLNITEVDRPDGTRQNFVYDPATNDLLSQSDTATNITTSQTFDSFGNLTSITSGRGKTSRTFYNSVGQVVSKTDPLNHTTVTYAYSGPLSLMTSVTNQFKQTTLTGYDSAGNVTSVTDFKNKTTLYTLDPLGTGNVIAVTDALGNKTRYEYDIWNRLTAVITPKGERTEYSYLPTGQLSQIKDAYGNIASFVFDDLGRVTQKTDALGFSTFLGYDKNGNLVSEKDPNGNLKIYKFDPANRLIAKILPDNEIDLGYDPVSGRLISVSNNVSALNFAFDQIGRQTSTQLQGRGALANLPPISLSYTLDSDSNRTALSYQVGSGSGNLSGTFGYGFDDDDRLISVQNPAGEIFGASYDDSTGTTTVTRPGSQTIATIDRLGSPATLTHSASSGGSSIASFVYNLDDIGRIQQVDTRQGSHVLGYDSDSQLTSATHPEILPPDPRSSESFSYDPIGNRSSDVYNPGGSASSSYLYDSKHQRLVEDYANFYFFDNNGNLISKQEKGITGRVTNYLYSSENQLMGIRVYPAGSSTPSLEVNYLYDALGRRISKQVINSTAPSDPTMTYTRRFVHDGRSLLLELDDQNNLLARYTHASSASYTPAAVDVQPAGVSAGLAQAAGSYYLLKDGLGSVIDVVDNQGNRLQHFVYSAYGQIVDIKNGAGVSVLGNPAQKPALDTPFTYAGLQYEKEAGLYYASARYLNPDIGRWLQKDSDPGSLGVPITVTNAYVYAGNSPFNLSDPSGTSILGDILAAVVVVATVVAVVATAGALGPVAGTLAGAGIGAVGGGLAGGILAASNGGSFASGFLAGALIGAAAGALLGAASGAGALSAGTGASGDAELVVDGGGAGGGGGGLGAGDLVSAGAPAQPAAHALAQAGVTAPQSTGALSDTMQVTQSAAKPVGDGVAGGAFHPYMQPMSAPSAPVSGGAQGVADYHGEVGPATRPMDPIKQFPWYDKPLEKPLIDPTCSAATIPAGVIGFGAGGPGGAAGAAEAAGAVCNAF